MAWTIYVSVLSCSLRAQRSMPIRDLRNLCWEREWGDKFLDYSTRSLHKCSALLWSSLGCQKDRKMHISHTLGPRHATTRTTCRSTAGHDQWMGMLAYLDQDWIIPKMCCYIVCVCVRVCVPGFWYGAHVRNTNTRSSLEKANIRLGTVRKKFLLGEIQT